MNTTRGILYVVGVVLVLAALWIFFVQAEMSRWVPAGIAVAAVILIVGVSVMSFAETSPADRDRLDRDRTVRDGGVTIVERGVEPRRRYD